MTLKHGDIWRAIDKLAERHGTSPSGLARKAGLSPTVFNTSKRATASRKRWPSTESIAHILRATGTTLDEFVALTTIGEGAAPAVLPLIGLDAARSPDAFDDDGRPAGKTWDEVPQPAIADPAAFVIEISGSAGAPVYREGDRLIVSPAEKPRRGDRIMLRTRKHDIIIGRLGRESSRTFEILPFGPDAAAIVMPVAEIAWMLRIIWASQ